MYGRCRKSGVYAQFGDPKSFPGLVEEIRNDNPELKDVPVLVPEGSRIPESLWGPNFNQQGVFFQAMAEKGGMFLGPMNTVGHEAQVFGLGGHVVRDNRPGEPEVGSSSQQGFGWVSGDLLEQFSVHVLNRNSAVGGVGGNREGILRTATAQVLRYSDTLIMQGSNTSRSSFRRENVSPMRLI